MESSAAVDWPLFLGAILHTDLKHNTIRMKSRFFDRMRQLQRSGKSSTVEKGFTVSSKSGLRSMLAEATGMCGGSARQASGVGLCATVGYDMRCRQSCSGYCNAQAAN